jgi:hypothetical protein
MTKQTVAEHLAEAKRDIRAGDKCYKSAANHIFAAQEEGASLRDIASKVGRSKSWVGVLLEWRAGGFQTDSPFASGHARAKEARETREKQARVQPAGQDEVTDALPNKVKINGQDVRVGDLGPAAQAQVAAQLGGDEEPAEEPVEEEAPPVIEEDAEEAMASYRAAWLRHCWPSVHAMVLRDLTQAHWESAMQWMRDEVEHAFGAAVEPEIAKATEEPVAKEYKVEESVAANEEVTPAPKKRGRPKKPVPATTGREQVAA